MVSTTHLASGNTPYTRAQYYKQLGHTDIQQTTMGCSGSKFDELPVTGLTNNYLIPFKWLRPDINRNHFYCVLKKDP